MKTKYNLLLTVLLISMLLVTGCGDQTDQKDKNDTSAQQETTAAPEETAATEGVLEDGVYTVDFQTDSSMFHVNEACEGKGTLTVADGKMTLHISLGSKNILNLYAGLAEDAAKEGAELLVPTTDVVTYSDGLTEEVYGFDVPVEALDEEFDLALIGKKNTWYDHKVSISNPVKLKDGEALPGSVKSSDSESKTTAALEDGNYTMAVTLEGGSGKASVTSPAHITVKDGVATARIEWSSPNYDYMKIGDVTYQPVNTEGNSVFEIPVSVFDEKMEVIADTVAMGTPHEIEYTLTFALDSAEKE